MAVVARAVVARAVATATAVTATTMTATAPADITRVPGEWCMLCGVRKVVFAYLVHAGKRLSEGRYPTYSV